MFTTSSLRAESQFIAVNQNPQTIMDKAANTGAFADKQDVDVLIPQIDPVLLPAHPINIPPLPAMP